MAFLSSRKLESTNNTISHSPLGQFIASQNKEKGVAYGLSRGFMLNTLNNSPQPLEQIDAGRGR
jgi:hypothetical protein